jgi:hypothetical protein
MDKIPLINPALIKVVTAKTDQPPVILKAEVISSTPVSDSPLNKFDSNTSAQENKSNSKETAQSEAKNQSEPRSPQETKVQGNTEDQQKTQNSSYKILLQIGQQKLETISNHNLTTGSQIEVKVLPGPELKIIKADTTTSDPIPAKISANQLALAQQLLSDRIPKIHQQDLSQIIKQLTSLISHSASKTSPDPSLTAEVNPKQETLKQNNLAPPTPDKSLITKSIANNTNLQNAGSQIYQQLQTQSVVNHPPNAHQHKHNTSTQKTSDTDLQTINANKTNDLQQQVKSWLHKLPQSQDVSTSTGLRNALNNTGVQSESQLSLLAQQSLQIKPKSANSIFQQLQSTQIDSATPDLINKSNAKSDSGEMDLTSLLKRTAKILTTNSQQALSNLSISKLITNNLQGNQTSGQITALPAGETSSTPVPSTTTHWQNPLLNNQTHLTFESLLQDPLFQTPSSNNKFALSQILGLNNPSSQNISMANIPLNWPERSGNDAALLRTLQNILGHIEREQIQQMQQSEGNQANPLNLQTTLNQQWLPLMINHHQQLQLIEFFIDKEEKQDSNGEKKNHWFINLHFDLPILGAMGIEITMFENECSTVFWSESRSALNQISHSIQPLRERLTEQGIIVSDIQSRYGTLEKRKNNIQQRLVDIST